LLVDGGIGRVALLQDLDQAGGEAGDGLRVVPEMRVVAGFAAEQIGDGDHDAARAWLRGEQAGHPGVVIGAVDNDDVGIREADGDRWAGGEKMRVLIGVVQDTADGDKRTADLAGDVAIHVFRRDNANGGRCACGWNDEPRGRQGQHIAPVYVQ